MPSRRILEELVVAADPLLLPHLLPPVECPAIVMVPGSSRQPISPQRSKIVSTDAFWTSFNQRTIVVNPFHLEGDNAEFYEQSMSDARPGRRHHRRRRWRWKGFRPPRCFRLPSPRVLCYRCFCWLFSILQCHQQITQRRRNACRFGEIEFRGQNSGHDCWARRMWRYLSILRWESR